MKYTKTKHTLFGYDKDNDLYEALFTASPDRMRGLGEIIARHQLQTDDLRCKETDEPFDWFVARDNAGHDIALFSYENPSGRDLTKFEQLKQALLNAGTSAIEDFVNQPVNPGASPADLNALMNETWMQMPWEELREFYEKYNIDLI